MVSYYQFISREENEDGSVVSTYKPTIHAQGAWNDNEQHMGPATGIICNELEQFFPRKNMRIGRISCEIYGLIYLSEFTITTRVIRPGKTIELIESTFESEGRICIVARTWRMVTEDTSIIEGIEDRAVPNFDDLPSWHGMSVWKGGYIDTVKNNIRVGERRPGKGIVWLTNQLEMVEGQPTSSFVKLMGMVDTINGVVVRQDGAFKYMFPNLDLQIHLYRMPVGTWLGLDVQQQYGADGIGLTSAVLHDEQGSFGHAEQILTVRKMRG